MLSVGEMGNIPADFLLDGCNRWRPWPATNVLADSTTICSTSATIARRTFGSRIGESLEKFSVAVVATDDGRFAYQVFLVCGEPRTLLTDSARYLTPDDCGASGLRGRRFNV